MIPLRKITNYSELVKSVKDEVRFMKEAGMIGGNGSINVMAGIALGENQEDGGT